MGSRGKVVLSAVLALTLAVLVAACGDSGSGGGSGSGSGGGAKAASGEPAALKKGSTVTLWIMPNGPHPQEDMEKAVAPFTQQTGVNVKVEVVGWDVQFDRIRNAAVSGEGPDVTQAGTTQVPFFAALGGFEDLSGRVGDVGGEAAYAPGVWKTTQMEGRDGVWALPWFTEGRTVYYRKDVLDKAGVDPSTAFGSLDSFRSTLETIKQKVPGIEPYGAPGKKAFDLVHGVMPFVWDVGGAELSADNKASTINSPEAEQGVKYVTDLIKDGLYDTSQLERDGTQVENQFKGGKLAVWIGGPWTLQSVGRKDDTNWVPQARNNVGVAPMPAGPSGDAYTFVGGSNLMLFKDSDVKNEAWALMKFLSQDQVQTGYADILGMFPSRKDAQAKVGESDANHEAFYQAIQNGRTYAPIPQWGQIENAYKTRFGNILDTAAQEGSSFNDADIAKQLDAAAKEADALLAQGAS